MSTDLWAAYFALFAELIEARRRLTLEEEDPYIDRLESLWLEAGGDAPENWRKRLADAIRARRATRRVV